MTVTGATYCRVSSDSQADGLGLPVQRDAVERYASEHGYEIAEAIEDVGFSGARADRPGLGRLLDLAEQGAIAVVVVPRWDRLARDAMLDGHLRYRLSALGVRVESATETNGIDPISQMTQQILSAVAGYERHLITARLRAARAKKRANGGYAGGEPPFGYRADGAGALQRDESEQTTLTYIRNLRESGVSYAAIARELNGLARHLPRRGKAWYPSTVRSVLTRC